ncbi:MAG: histidine phosphatase family protein [Coriobacteriia bacterium]|nr:histidine phosphatase family protein [Coriobacteriia bacterium]
MSSSEGEAHVETRTGAHTETHSGTHILLVRHPETEANVSGRFVGRGSSPYTAKGLQQLGQTAASIAAFAPDAIWTSPLDRTVELAEKAAGMLGLTAHADERLAEIDFGKAEGMTLGEAASAGFLLNYWDIVEPVAPGGESRLQLGRRVAECVDRLIEQSPCERIAIVTHGGVLRFALAHLLGLRSDDIWAFHVKNAQLAHVQVRDGSGMLERYWTE